MSAFTGSLTLEEIEPGRRWRLVNPLRFEAREKGSGLIIEVPAGFETDGATMPRFLTSFLAVWGSYGRAAALHDYLYSIIGDNKLWGCNPVSGGDVLHPAFEGCLAMEFALPMHEYAFWARKWADEQFYLAMLACGTSRRLAFIIWASVRLFGELYVKGAKP